MSRPRIALDVAQVRRLHADGAGTRRIARQLGVSRSTIGRILAGNNDADADAKISVASRAPGSGPGSAPPPVARSARHDPRRDHARGLLEIARGSATDEEFGAAMAHLDALLAQDGAGSAWLLSSMAESSMREAVRRRELAAAEAQHARTAWEQSAAADLCRRWDCEVALLRHRVPRLDGARGRQFDAAVAGEGQRAAEVLVRRLVAMSAPTRTEPVVDDLVGEGLARVAAAVEARS